MVITTELKVFDKEVIDKLTWSEYRPFEAFFVQKWLKISHFQN